MVRCRHRQESSGSDVDVVAIVEGARSATLSCHVDDLSFVCLLIVDGGEKGLMLSCPDRRCIYQKA